jgi:L-iditol 2-dehydrogenase
MKAGFLVGPQTIELRDVPDPVVPDDGIILKVESCGVCGSDLRRWREGPPAGVEGIVQGHEVSGTVIEVGKDVVDYAVGDKLAVAPDIHCGKCYYCERGMFNLCDDLTFIGITPGINGGFAEKVVLTGKILKDGIVNHMPDDMPFPVGSLAETLSSVLASHEQAGTSLNDLVLVMGAGPIGCLHISVSKARGARVVVSEPVEFRRETAQRFEPDAIVDPFNEDLEAKVRAMTDGRGADIVICANPIAATQTQAVEIVRKAGRVVLFGGLPKADPIVKLDSNKIHYGEVEVVGAFSYHPTAHQNALGVLHRGLIPTDLMITHTFPLEKVGEAFETANSGAGLKVIVKPNS